MVSYQCSPLSTPDGIVGTFRQCAKFQQDKDLNTFVSVVVLDEVGLAEDSPLMPLKVQLNYHMIIQVQHIISVVYMYLAVMVQKLLWLFLL